MNLKQVIKFCDSHKDYYRSDDRNDMARCIDGLQILIKHCYSGYLRSMVDLVRAGNLDNKSNYSKDEVETLYRLGWCPDDDHECWEFSID